MIRILHVEASPRREASRSSEAAAAFLAEVATSAADAEIDRLGLWDEPLPELDGDALAAKYARLAGTPLTPAQQAAWDGVAGLVERLDAADAVLISTPMWNLSLPYRLKHWIDLVTQPGLSFSFDPASGYAPLLRPRPTVAILASAGDFSSGRSFGRADFASDYLRAALGFIGLTGAVVAPVQPTAGPPDHVAAGVAAARDRLAALARTFSGAGR
ncbi:FMN-dependent NADH-azoreductase [Chenggangzhangella methanolivorans]|uniref:FMN dependent NADH:quinone oxidoreductase n=1 Tax=Chenggangzhangella methanolivorans TaxID=1437009 RepID=A0A9E6REC9_9HYPH|nr:NAD(P)H-dependent oxidoreductase [Chenggangzhangella methanolivorans]QZO01899.1 NAD(P)H-dependent oxidoreductase [Chenggangzhangella methanolivorans]